jgi:hypothetical protein
MSWEYEIETGKMFDPSGALVGTGYAGGDEGRSPIGTNNPDMQNVKGVGPLPCGLYTFATPIPQSHLGPFAIPLIPDPKNEMFGRGSFYCHGDTVPSGKASEGCIIQNRSTRNAMWASTDHTLIVRLENA